ncbi:MAG: RHS repeat domain-containing protein [Planctomycetaceae bacterium]
MCDASGDVQERYAYQPYGQLLFLDPAFVAKSNSSFDWDRLFTGQTRDESSSLYPFRERRYHQVLGLFTSRDPLMYVDGFSLYEAYFVPNMVDPSGTQAVDCRCCEAAISDAQRTGLHGLGTVRNRPSIRGPRTGRDCPVTMSCRAGCPNRFPATTNFVVRGGTVRISICIDCRMANANLHQTLVHELQHAQDFCDFPGFRRNLANCIQFETSAYEASCGVLYPDRGNEYQRCVECGVYFSCRDLGARAPVPPCDLSGGVPTKPCWRYDPRRGFVWDSNDPRCRQNRQRNRNRGVQAR